MTAEDQLTCERGNFKQPEQPQLRQRRASEDIEKRNETSRSTMGKKRQQTSAPVPSAFPETAEVALFLSWKTKEKADLRNSAVVGRKIIYLELQIIIKVFIWVEKFYSDV